MEYLKSFVNESILKWQENGRIPWPSPHRTMKRSRSRHSSEISQEHQHHPHALHQQFQHQCLKRCLPLEEGEEGGKGKERKRLRIRRRGTSRRVERRRTNIPSAEVPDINPTTSMLPVLYDI